MTKVPTRLRESESQDLVENALLIILVSLASITADPNLATAIVMAVGNVGIGLTSGS